MRQVRHRHPNVAFLTRGADEVYSVLLGIFARPNGVVYPMNEPIRKMPTSRPIPSRNIFRPGFQKKMGSKQKLSTIVWLLVVKKYKPLNQIPPMAFIHWPWNINVNVHKPY